MMSRAKGQKPRGLALLEVLIASVIISVGLLSLAGMQARQLYYSQQALLQLQGLYAMENKLESFRARSSSLSAGSGALPFSDISSGSQTLLDSPIELSWEVSPVSGMAVDVVKRVDIQASWRDRFGHTHNKKLTTLLSRYGEFD